MYLSCALSFKHCTSIRYCRLGIYEHKVSFSIAPLTLVDVTADEDAQRSYLKESKSE